LFNGADTKGCPQKEGNHIGVRTEYFILYTGSVSEDTALQVDNEGEEKRKEYFCGWTNPKTRFLEQG